MPATASGALASALQREIAGEVRFGAGDRHLYATDASNFRQVPVGVVVPRTIDDVVAAVAICREHGVAITNRGGGTSLAGQCTNTGVIVDGSKYLRAIRDLDPDRRVVTCEPGTVLDALNAHTERRAGLTWGPDPSTADRCTVGGMIGNNACGVRAFAYGPTEDNVAELDVLLYDGTRLAVGPTSEEELDRTIAVGGARGRIHRELRDLRDRHAHRIRTGFPDIPRRVSGFNLPRLLPEQGFDVARALVGSEGTCVTILGATLQLHEHLPYRTLVILGYPDVYAAADHVAEVRRSGAVAVEGVDRRLIGRLAEQRLHAAVIDAMPPGDGWLLVEFAGRSRQEAVGAARSFAGEVRRSPTAPSVRICGSDAEAAAVWRARKAGVGAATQIADRQAWPGWEDSAVHPDRLGSYLRDLRRLFDDFGYDAALYGHFGDGCVHCRIDFDLTSASGVAAYRDFLTAAADLVSSYGGSYSGEHGDGQQRGPLLERMFGSELVDAFREFKAIWDPEGGMNPGKVVDARGVDEDLRLGVDTRVVDEVDLRFGYPRDGGSFAAAQLRCVGIGACRQEGEHGVMCPSYVVTREEMHSTRGRARLLFEMLRPGSELDGWHDESVHAALDLCLSCKGCTSECPVNVDIPTYKAEFLHHHYDGRRRPRVHYTLGLIDRWARLASRAPSLANLLLQTPGIQRLAKRAAGVAPERPAPRFASRTFRRWFADRQPPPGDGPPVVLFVDTFTDHLEPHVGRAVVAVLERAGYRVTVPAAPLCCGRPLYDHGLLDRAHHYLDRLIAALRGAADAGVPIVGIEPSCTAVLRDELLAMEPDDADAMRIAAATVDLAEFLTADPGFEFPRLGRPALVHGHCHQKAVAGTEALGRALDAMGVDWSELDAGCCGLAGSFGFEAGEKFEVSVKVGERSLLPAVRQASAETLLIADGYSCRTQIEHLQRLNGTGAAGHRRALHLAEVIELARASDHEG